VNARAQSGNGAVAQALFDQAKQLLADGHVLEACPKLEESQRLEPRSGTLINLAYCYEQSGRLASAWSKYLEAAAAAKATGNQEREAVARERATALAPRCSKLTIAVAPALTSVPGLEIKRDGVLVGEPAWGLSLPSDAGDHEVTANAPGRVPFKTKVRVVGEGVTTTVSVPVLAPEPSAAPGPSTSTNHGLGTQRTVALVAGGVGVIGFGLGAAFGLVSKSKHDQAARECDGAACPDESALAAANAAQSYGNLSTAMMIVGGVGLAKGVMLWLTAPNAKAPPAQVGLGLGTLHVKGTF
jgi:tetratricopeptide (TPR) repeat protein